MTPSEILSAFMSRSDAIDNLWNYYLTISFAMIGFILSQSGRNGPAVPIIVSLGFSAFAYFNYQAIQGTTAQAIAFFEALKSAPPEQAIQALTNSVQFTQSGWVAQRHVIGDAIVLAGIWVAHFYKQSPA